MTKRQVTAVDVLKRAEAILRRGWAKGYYAKTARGAMVEVHDKRATRYCLTGARFKAESELEADRQTCIRAGAFLHECIPHGYQSVEEFNDSISTNKAKVLSLVDCAIKKAQA